MEIIKDILLAASLCADCFAVALCASVSMKGVRWGEVMRIALIFAVIQTAFLFIGWAFGDFIARYIIKIVSYVGMALLAFVGISMIKEAFSDEEPHNLDGLRNIIIAGVADSIDALAVGISMSMAGRHIDGMPVPVVAVFIITALSVVLGIKGGSFIGSRAGRPAAVIGGIVLILLGINIPLGLF
ncbi:MAG: manganese efflux pump [Bacteroidales bacterium]|nr:manganese efflux pump [Bacteroidales bacterium]